MIIHVITLLSSVIYCSNNLSVYVVHIICLCVSVVCIICLSVYNVVGIIYLSVDMLFV